MNSNHVSRRVAIIGAGPIGVAAALGALERGFDVSVFEKGDVGQALRSWGQTRFFSPLRMNVSPAMRALLGAQSPEDDALLTGLEMVERVLLPIAESELLRGRIRTHTRVVAIGRRGLTRGDYAGHPIRSERPFRLVVATGGTEEVVEADVVLDATGGYAAPNAVGVGGLPAPGESRLGDRAIRTLGDLDQRRGELKGKHVLLVGNGHSAANAIGVLQQVAAEDPSTVVTWAVRTPNRRPCEEVADDPLLERARVVAIANDLAADPPPFLHLERRAMVESLSWDGDRWRASLSGGRSVSCDFVAGFTGFHPDGNIHSELVVEISPVTEGSARLYRAISNVTDCLSVPRLSRDDLQSGEPGFYFIGSRSYGRARSFLLQNGLSQLETILDSIPR